MTEPYYNLSYGTGLEGVMNYTNEIVSGYMGATFIFCLYIVMLYVLSKSEWRISAVIVYTSFVCLLLSWILTLFITFPERFLLIQAVILSAAVFWSIVDNQIN